MDGQGWGSKKVALPHCDRKSEVGVGEKAGFHGVTSMVVLPVALHPQGGLRAQQEPGKTLVLVKLQEGSRPWLEFFLGQQGNLIFSSHLLRGKCWRGC